MIELEIRLFATLKDRVGQDRIQLTLSEPVDVQALIEAAGEAYPSLNPALSTVIVAVNKAFAGPDTTLQAGDEIAMFPPVSGGANAQPTYFLVTTDRVDLNAIQEKLVQPDVGAVVTFTGSVRGLTSRDGLPPSTEHLEYQAYEEMATLKMAQIAAEIWEQWPLVKGVAIVQRIGRLEIGETTTIVACAAAHRDQGAFEAARYGIDRLKEIVPVWKKEIGMDQSVWVEGDYRPSPEDNR